jgi:hypothetical protein
MTQVNEAVRAHLHTVASEIRRRDADTLLELMARITGEEPRMWGPSIIGFGSYHYRYASGREGDAPAAGFSPRKAATSVYLPDGIDTYAKQLARLGEHKAGIGCLYLKDLAKIDLEVLESIITESYRAVTVGTFGHRASESQTEQRK